MFYLGYSVSIQYSIVSFTDSCILRHFKTNKIALAAAPSSPSSKQLSSDLNK